MIELVNISKAFGKKKVLDNLTVSLPVSGLVVLRGQNGSGKSTLLNIIAGQDYKHGGKMYFAGRLVDRKYGAWLSENIVSYVTQDPIVFEDLSVMENILFPYQSQDKERAKAVLKEVGLLNLALEKTNNLSEGEKQRLCFARALFKNPKVILADEVIANLDYGNAKVIIELMARLSQKALVIFATHDDLDSFALSGYSNISLENGKIKTDIMKNQEMPIAQKGLVSAGTESRANVFWNDLNHMFYGMKVNILLFSLLAIITAIFGGSSLSLTSSLVWDKGANVDYIFETYPVIIAESYQSVAKSDVYYELSYTPLSDKDKSNENEAFASYESRAIWSTLYVPSDEKDTTLIPKVILGETPKNATEVLIPYSRFSYLKNDMGLDSLTDQQAISQIESSNVAFGSISYDEGLTYEKVKIVGVYEDFREVDKELLEFLKSKASSGESVLESSSGLEWVSPDTVLSMQAYGFASAISVMTDDDLHSSLVYQVKKGIVSNKYDLENIREKVNQDSINLLDFEEYNPFIRTNDLLYPFYDQNLNVARIFTAVGWPLVGLSALSFVLMAIYLCLGLKRRVIMLRVVGARSSDIRMALILGFSLVLLLSLALIVSTSLIISAIGNGIMSAYVIPETNVVFASYSWQYYLTVIAGFISSLILVVLGTNNLFKEKLPIEYKKLNY